MTTYNVHLTVAANLLPTLLSTIERTRGIILASITVAEGEEPKTRTPRYHGGKRDKGISAQDLMLEALASGSHKYSDLEKIAKARGFAPSSVSAVLSKMVTAGTVVRSGPRNARAFSLKKKS